MFVDGRKIAANLRVELQKQVRTLGRSLTLAVVEVGRDAATETFIERKKKFGEAIGVEVMVHQYSIDSTEEVLAAEVRTLGAERDVDGLIVQLPLPFEIGVDIVVESIPPEKDVDALSSSPRVRSPVVGAVAEIFARYSVNPRGKRAVVVGEGRLVGKPIAHWLEEIGAYVDVVSLETTEMMRLLTERADVIISGAGVPRLITPELVKDGVVLIDAGTSESEGKLVGDIDPACAEKAALYTPVPGGVGPITVAKLFENLLKLAAAS